jgi:hypothetical protein
VALATRTPAGIRFEAQPPPPAIVLPRMDVAGFVGFAACGPLDVPVPVEDAIAFADVFGPDVELAWDARRGEHVHAALGPAVRSFLRNGGRRCHVVRVAGPSARTSGVQLPGVLAVGPGGLEWARMRARSAGSWADRLSVAVSVAASPVSVALATVAADTLDVVAPSTAPVGAGDMLRVPFGDGWTLLAAIAAVDPSTPGVRQITTRAAVGPRLWVQPHVPRSGRRFEARWLDPRGNQRSVPAHVAAGRGGRRLVLRSGLELAPAEGALVELTGAGETLWARIGARERVGRTVLLAFAAVRTQARTPRGVVRASRPRGGQRLELELWTQAAGTRHRLGALGLAAGHPRYAAALPVDEALYTHTGAHAPRQDVPELWRAAREPRFPLAGPAAPPDALFPVAASLVPGPWLAALRPAGNARTRDGLDRLRSSVFFDARLAGAGTGALVTSAQHILEGGAGAPPRLRGLHALLGVEEVSLAAVPDAAQRGWSVPASAAPGPPVVEDGGAGGEPGAFAACERTRLVAPEVTLVTATGGLRLVWTVPPPGARAEVQEAGDAGFETAVELYEGDADALELGTRPPGARWYRVRHVRGEETGPWGAAGPAGDPAQRGPALRAPARYRDAGLVDVHRALLRLCAARGDVLALLSVPEHYREDDAARHVARLGQSGPGAAAVAPLAEGDERTPSFGALHHPWLVSVDADRPGVLRRVPPDGAMAGVAAGRAVTRGAWVAPANVPLVDVVALAHAPAAERRAELLAARVNVVERTPRGFLALSADTLAADDELRPINVRRLLSLLRRLALRHGEVYAFEPNGDPLRRAALRGFEAVLGALFRLGAFAGTRPADGFRVVVSTPREEQLLVELKVAPSRPLAFLTVRLVRAGDGRLLVETLG